jgi:hypothetical protein
VSPVVFFQDSKFLALDARSTPTLSGIRQVGELNEDMENPERRFVFGRAFLQASGSLRGEDVTAEPES